MTRYYVKTEEGKLFVRVNNCGINFLIFMTDGIPVVSFPGLKSKYVSVDVALEWHKKELEYGLANGYHKDSIEMNKAAINVLSDALAKSRETAKED